MVERIERQIGNSDELVRDFLELDNPDASAREQLSRRADLSMVDALLRHLRGEKRSAVLSVLGSLIEGSTDQVSEAAIFGLRTGALNYDCSVSERLEYFHVLAMTGRRGMLAAFEMIAPILSSEDSAKEAFSRYVSNFDSPRLAAALINHSIQDRGYELLEKALELPSLGDQVKAELLREATFVGLRNGDHEAPSDPYDVIRNVVSLVSRSLKEEQTIVGMMTKALREAPAYLGTIEFFCKLLYGKAAGRALAGHAGEFRSLLDETVKILCSTHNFIGLERVVRIPQGSELSTEVRTLVRKSLEAVDPHDSRITNTDLIKLILAYRTSGQDMKYAYDTLRSKLSRSSYGEVALVLASCYPSADSLVDALGLVSSLTGKKKPSLLEPFYEILTSKAWAPFVEQNLAAEEAKSTGRFRLKALLARFLDRGNVNPSILGTCQKLLDSFLRAEDKAVRAFGAKVAGTKIGVTSSHIELLLKNIEKENHSVSACEALSKQGADVLQPYALRIQHELLRYHRIREQETSFLISAMSKICVQDSDLEAFCNTISRRSRSFYLTTPALECQLSALTATYSEDRARRLVDLFSSELGSPLTEEGCYDIVSLSFAPFAHSALSLDSVTALRVCLVALSQIDKYEIAKIAAGIGASEALQPLVLETFAWPNPIFYFMEQNLVGMQRTVVEAELEKSEINSHNRGRVVSAIFGQES